MASIVRIRLEPSGQIIEAPRKANLLRTLQAAGIPVGSSCGGNGVCASCKIIVLEGIKNLSAPSDLETELKTRNNLGDQERISCQCKVFGDITITTNYW